MAPPPPRGNNANRRLFAVADVVRAFNSLVAQFKGEATADVTVAEQLNDKHPTH
jgi:F-type H+-transporting ATPase subunit delta